MSESRGPIEDLDGMIRQQRRRGLRVFDREFENCEKREGTVKLSPGATATAGGKQFTLTILRRTRRHLSY